MNHDEYLKRRFMEIMGKKPSDRSYQDLYVLAKVVNQFKDEEEANAFMVEFRKLEGNELSPMDSEGEKRMEKVASKFWKWGEE